MQSADERDPTMLDRESYEATLRGLYIPDAILETRPDPLGEAACGDSRDLEHDYWLLATDDPTVKLEATMGVNFTSAVHPLGVRLSDDSMRSDRLTKKILCLRLLTTGARGRPQAARSVVQLCRAYDWYVRWRSSIGVKRTQDLKENHFEDFVERLRAGGVFALVPLSDRLLDHVRRIRDGERSLEVHDVAGALKVDWTRLGLALGVSGEVLTADPAFRKELALALVGLAPAINLPSRRLGGERRDPDRQRSMRAFETPLQLWDALAHLSQTGALAHDPLRLDPLQGTSVSKLASQLGRPRERTRTLTPHAFMALLSSAVTWVVEYGPHILAAVAETNRLATGRPVDRLPARRLKASEALDTSLPSGMPRLYLSWRTVAESGAVLDRKDRLSTIDAVKFLLVAAFILLGGFGARRIGETLSLRAGCVREARPGLFVLSAYIEKTLRRYDEIPVPSLISVVVSTLERLTADPRAATGEEWLFRPTCRSKGENHTGLGFDANLEMKRFAEYNGHHQLSGVDAGDLASHQLRRGYAVYYYHGNQWSNLDTLSLQLRQFDSETTRLYVEEAVLGAMTALRDDIRARTDLAARNQTAEERAWLDNARATLAELASRKAVFDEVRCEDFVHRMLQVSKGVERPIGRGAARLSMDIAAMTVEAASDVRVGSRLNGPEAVSDALLPRLQEYTARNRLDPVPGGVAHCRCRPEDEGDLATAACVAERERCMRSSCADGHSEPVRRPVFAFASSYVCLDCVHCVVFATGERRIEEEVARTGLAATQGASETAREAAARLYAEYSARLQGARDATTGGVA